MSNYQVVDVFITSLIKNICYYKQRKINQAFSTSVKKYNHQTIISRYCFSRILRTSNLESSFFNNFGIIKIIIYFRTYFLKGKYQFQKNPTVWMSFSDAVFQKKSSQKTKYSLVYGLNKLYVENYLLTITVMSYLYNVYEM